MAHRKILPILVIGLMLGGIHPSIDAQAQSDTGNLPIVAWVGSNQLWVSDASGTARVLVNEDVQAAALSPNRTQIAYHTGENLTVLEVGSGEMIATLSADVFLPNPEISDSIPGFSAPYWVSDSTLWLNTIDFYTSYFGYKNRYDIQQWNISENGLIEIAPSGAGGMLFPSPDHSKVAIYRPGHYQDLSNPAVIEIMDVNTGTVLGDSITFPSVASASELPWYPTITWSNSSDAIGFSIPNSDLLYFENSELPPTQVCVMAVLGRIECQWSIIYFYSLPIFNTDLTQWVSLQPTQSTWALVIGQMDESLKNMWVIPREDLEPAVAGMITIGPIAWLEDGRVLIRVLLEYGPQPQTQILSLDVVSGEAIAWPNVATSSQVMNLQSLENDLYAIAYGDFFSMQVMIYDAATQTLIPLTLPTTTETMGWVAFALR